MTPKLSLLESKRKIFSLTIERARERCRSYNVDPQGGNPRILTEAELEKRLRRRRELLEIARSTMENLHSLVAGSNFVIMLADENSAILEIMGDPEALEAASHIKLVRGAIWSEETVGNSAIMSAILEDVPIQVVGQEHYCLSQQGITCSAAPIHDSQGEVIGALDMSASCELVHPHTLGMVVAAATSIEKELAIRKALEERSLANEYLRTTLDCVSDGILALDRGGVINHVNARTAEIVGLRPEEVMGRSAAEILGQQPLLDRVLQSGKELRDAEIIVRSPRRRAGCLISANPILSHQGQIIGVVATLKRIETVHWLVNRMTGAEARFTFSDIMGQSGKMKQAVKIGRIAAECSSVVLLQGESGTGKELFAQAIHRAGLGDRPFVALNCGAIPRSLLESELFGYEGGSFTGADKRGRPGKFELADGGTVFLDEIGEMPLDMQVVLLRVLEEKKVYRIGGQRAIPLNVRVITATNKNLASEIEKGRFREDLYYRLNVLTIDIPPLRERKEDIPLLCDHFLKQIGSRLNKKVEGIDPLALQRLISYHWPGNVRELENVLERGIILGSGSLLRICDLPDYLQNLEASSWQPEIAFERTSGEKNKSLGEVEKTLIAEALRSTEGNITQAARILGIGRSTLYRKMSRYTLSSR